MADIKIQQFEKLFHRLTGQLRDTEQLFFQLKNEMEKSSNALSDLCDLVTPSMFVDKLSD